MNRRAFLATLGAAAAAPVVPAIAARTVPTRNVLLCAQSMTAKHSLHFMGSGGFMCRHSWHFVPAGTRSGLASFPTEPFHPHAIKMRIPNL